jgi:hypothetical protein
LLPLTCENNPLFSLVVVIILAVYILHILFFVTFFSVTNRERIVVRRSLYFLRYSLLRCPYTYESGSRVRLSSGSNESNSSVCGVSRAGLGRSWLGLSGPSVGLGSPPACYWLVRVWEVPSQTRVSTRPQTQTAQVLSLKRRKHVGYHV